MNTFIKLYILYIKNTDLTLSLRRTMGGEDVPLLLLLEKQAKSKH